MSIISRSNFVFADIIEINNGEKLNCLLVRWSQYATEVSVYGTKRQIQSNLIKQISTDSIVEVRLSSGEIAIGKVVIDDSGIYVNSNMFGIIKFPEEKQVSSIHTTLTEADISKKMKYAEKKSQSPTIDGESKNPPLDYLRGATVLRSPGEIEVYYSFDYKRARSENYVLEAFSNEIVNRTLYKFTSHIGVTAGLFEDFEGWVDIPFSYLTMEDVEGQFFHASNDNFNIGDISAGLNYQLLRERTNFPAITTSLSVSAPTGDSPYQTFPNGAVASGNGHWIISPSIGFVSTVDPIVLFYGLGYDHYFPTMYNGTEYSSGDRINYYAGMGFTVNDRLSLSTKVFGSHEFEYKINGESINGSSKDPFSIGFGVSYRIGNNLIVYPNVSIGANDDAPDFDAGFTLSKTF